jgi:hypothetical protein
VIKKFGYVVVGLVLSLSACQTAPVPITPSLINYVGASNLEQFYFYLSKDVTLQRYEIYNDTVRFQDGMAIPIERDISQTVLIRKNTPGVVKKNMLTEAAYVTYTKSADKVRVTVEKNGEVIQTYDAENDSAISSARVSDANQSVTYQILGVTFEDGDGREIGFAVLTSDPDGTFDMLFDDELTGSVLYDEKMYRAMYKGDERPCLTVRLAKGEMDKTGSKKRVAGGNVANKKS